MGNQGVSTVERFKLTICISFLVVAPQGCERMEDALVSFVTKGKADFRSLAQSILSDIARLTLRQTVMKPLVGFLTNFNTGKPCLFLLERVNQELIDAVLAKTPAKVVALDRLFDGNDALKSNTVLQMKDAGVVFE